MRGGDIYPRYAIRLLVLIVFSVVIFFVGLSLFVPEGSKLTGSYDAESLIYIASAPASYRGSASCGASNCHSLLFKKWSEGGHGARGEQSKCEVCHGPQGAHPAKVDKLPLVRGDGNIVELCLSCHRKMKARKTTGQPQISPLQHPFPHKEMITCLQCHDPHSPGLKTAKSSAKISDKSEIITGEISQSEGVSIGDNCFSCHGSKGRGGFAPELAGQSFQSLLSKLTKFRSGEIKGTMMQPIVENLTDKEIDELAQYFSKLP